MARRGFTLIEILVIVILVGILFSVSFKSFSNARDRSVNAAIDGNVKKVHQALLVYEADYERFPERLVREGPNAPPAGFDTGVGSVENPLPTILLNPQHDRRYLPGNMLPLTPFSERWQGNNLLLGVGNAAGMTNAMGVYTIAQLQTANPRINEAAVLRATNTPITNTGRVPDQPVNGRATALALTKDHYGAIIYQTDNSRKLFVLYGVGKSQSRARIAGFASNAN